VADDVRRSMERGVKTFGVELLKEADTLIIGHSLHDISAHG